MVSTMRLDRPRSAGYRVRAITASPRDEALLAEDGADLLDGRVRAREHQLGRTQIVFGQLAAGRADAGQEPLQGGLEGVLVVGVDPFLELLVEPVQLLLSRRARGLLGGTVVLRGSALGRLGGRTELLGGGGAAQLAADAAQLRLDHDVGGGPVQLGLEPVAGLREVVEGAGSHQLVQRAGAGLHLRDLVLGPLHGQADVAHLLADAGDRLVDACLRLGGGVGGLDRLLAGTEGLDLDLEPLRGVDQLGLLGLELVVLDLVGAARGRGLLARSSRFWPTAWRAWFSSLVADCWRVCAWSSTRLREVATSATPRRIFWSSSSCRS